MAIQSIIWNFSYVTQKKVHLLAGQVKNTIP